MQHATQFSFDRLKLIFPMSISIGIIFAYLGSRYFRITFQSLIIASSVFSLFTYYGQLNDATGITWSKYHNWNHLLSNQLSTQVDFKCASLSSSFTVRGYANLLFHRSIYENVATSESAIEIMKNSNSCASIYLKGFNYATDLPVYTEVQITFPDGRKRSIQNPL